MITHKILIVDDEPSNLKALVNHIESVLKEMEVLQVLNGKMALLIAQQASPDLIITDWEMPGMDGIELIRRLKEDNETKDIPVIMCTGSFVTQQHLGSALDAGAVDYIRKPVDPVELSARVRSMLALAARTREMVEEKARHAVTVAELEKERAEKAAQQALMEKEQAERSEELKKQFFSMITHEFRTPVSLILGPLEEIFRDTKENQTRRLSEIGLGNSKILLRLINQLLTLARMESGYETLSPQRLDLVSFALEKMRAFMPMARQKDLTLKNISSLETLFGDFDPLMMEKVLINLLSNAIKFTPKGGVVTICVEEDTNSSENIKVGVKDTGVGIPAEKQPFVFDRFYRVDGSKTSELEGTGLGLPLAKSLVELHGGEIQLVSIEGLGTEVTVTLPKEQNIKGGSPVDQFPSTRSEPPHMLHPALLSQEEDENDIEEGKDNVILVIEDNPAVRDYIRLILEPAFQVIEARDGSSGLEKANQFVPNLIITDVMMPGMDGFEVCRTLKKTLHTSHIPLIILTAKSSMEEKIEGLETGADEFLSKPFNSKELLARINNLITNRNNLQDRFRKTLASAATQVDLPSQEEQFLLKLRSIMATQLGNETFSVEEFATEVAMSRSQLFRKLKALTDQSVSEFIRNYRLEHAYQLLEKNVAPIGEVAFMVGFSSPSTFSKSFSAKFGVPPKDIRRGNNP